MDTLVVPSVMNSPESILENYLAVAAARNAPIAVDSEDGKRLYRALAYHVWCRFQRPVMATDIRDLWERIDSIKRGATVRYPIYSIHFWAADFANSLVADSVPLDPVVNQRLAAWLDDWPNICILGQTGRGKSSTINRIFGVKMAEISHHASCTSTVTDYRLVTGTFLGRPTGITLWDVPGYGDDRMTWDTYVKLYRRLARRCDVVVLMVDNDRALRMDLKMFQKLKKITSLESKLVVALNKADLFFPCTWDETKSAPSPEMNETLSQRIAVIGDNLDLRSLERIVPISALKNWNMYSLLTAMISAAGESKGASLLRAVRPDGAGTDGTGEKRTGDDLGRRFGINPGLRDKFRSLIA